MDGKGSGIAVVVHPSWIHYFLFRGVAVVVRPVWAHYFLFRGIRGEGPWMQRGHLRQ